MVSEVRRMETRVIGRRRERLLRCLPSSASWSRCQVRGCACQVKTDGAVHLRSYHLSVYMWYLKREKIKFFVGERGCLRRDSIMCEDENTSFVQWKLLRRPAHPVCKPALGLRYRRECRGWTEIIVRERKGGIMRQVHMGHYGLIEACREL